MKNVLEGSVQRDANRVRVNAQLIDAESGAHLWADRFEEDEGTCQSRMQWSPDLARTLQIELVNAEAQRSLHDRPRNPDAIDLTMRGLALLNQGHDESLAHEARDLFEQALTLDLANADAFAGAAWVDVLAIARAGPIRGSTCMRGRCSGLIRLSCSIPTKRPRTWCGASRLPHPRSDEAQ